MPSRAPARKAANPPVWFVVYCPHTTAGVIIQEAEQGLLDDLEGWLRRTVPQDVSLEC